MEVMNTMNCYAMKCTEGILVNQYTPSISCYYKVPLEVNVTIINVINVISESDN